MKKVLNIIIVLTIILVTCINISVRAEDKEKSPEEVNENIEITLKTKGETELIKGNSIEISIDLALLNEEKVNGVQLLIQYDEKTLKLNEEESFIPPRETRWDYPTVSNYNGEIGLVTTRDEERGNLSGEICNLVFEVLETTNSTKIEMKEIYCSFIEKLMYAKNYTLDITMENTDPEPTPGEKLYLSTEIYKIGNSDINNYEDGDKYISRVEKETTKEEFIENLKTNGTIRIKKHDGTELGANELVGTGMTIEVTKEEEKIELQIAVMGDLDGNGKVTATDLSTLNQTILKMVTLENEYKIAGDLDENEKITATDLSTLNKMLLKIL